MPVVTDVKIDPEFHNLIPPLTDDERATLTESIIREGCREPLVAWKETGILLDGHNRRSICRLHEKDFRVVAISFPDRNAAKAWVIRNQLGRRNLTPFQRADLALELEPLLADQAKGNQKKGGNAGGVGRQKSDNPIDTKKELAKAAGVSHDTIHKVKVIKEEAPAEVQEMVRSGEMSINRAYEAVRPPQSKPAARHESKDADNKFPVPGGPTPSELAKNSIQGRWSKAIHDCTRTLNSIDALGGVEKLVRSFAPGELESYVKDLREMRDEIEGWIKKLEPLCETSKTNKRRSA